MSAQEALARLADQAYHTAGDDAGRERALADWGLVKEALSATTDGEPAMTDEPTEQATAASWTYGDMYATPARLHVCNRCGQASANPELHDEWHATRAATEATP